MDLTTKAAPPPPVRVPPQPRAHATRRASSPILPREAFTNEKIHERLALVEQFHEIGHITPRSERFFEAYAEAAQDLLTCEGTRWNQVFTDSCNRLHFLDKHLERSSFSKISSAAQKQLELNIMQLKRYEYFVRYQEFLNTDYLTLRSAIVTVRKTPAFHQYFHELAANLQSELSTIRIVLNSTIPPPPPTLTLIGAAARALGLRWTQVLRLIAEFNEDITLDRRRVTRMLERADSEGLKRTLQQDKMDLNMIISPGSVDCISSLRGVIEMVQRVRIKYFETFGLEPDPGHVGAVYFGDDDDMDDE